MIYCDTGFENFKPKIKLNHNIKMYKSVISYLEQNQFACICEAENISESNGIDSSTEQQLITASLMSLPVGQLTTKSYM